MESAVANLCSPGEPVLVVSAGYFGERWAGARAGVRRRASTTSATTGARSRRADDVAARLRERAATAVFLTHSETSTGVVTDLQPFAAAAREAGALSVVDAVSSLGAVPLETDAWGIDVVASGAQKALMTPPGLAMVSASEAARNKSARRDLAPRFYWDWERTRKGQATLDAPGHAAGLARRGPRRRAEDAARGRSRGRLRAPHQARPRLPRRPQGDGPRALLARRGQLGRRDRRARARRHRLGRARAPAARPPRRHARAGPGRAEGQDLPHRPHRLLRRLRHHDRARGGRAGAGRARRRDRARRRGHARARGVRAHPG